MPSEFVPREFFRIDVELLEQKLHGALTDDVVDSLARNFGWYDAVQLWKKVNVDSQGRLLVSLNAGQIGNLTVSRPTVAAVATKLLTANVNRRRWEIRNTGLNDAAWGANNGVTLANGVTIGAGRFDGDDIYIGDVWAISSGAGSTFEVIEE